MVRKTTQKKFALKGLFMNKAQCKDYVHTSEFTDYVVDNFSRR